MYFDTIQQLIEMDGHGFYVWLSYGMACLVFGGFIIVTRVKRQRLIKHYKRMLAQSLATQSVVNNEVEDKE